MPYSHSLINDCGCVLSRFANEAQVVDGLTVEEIEVLFHDAPIVETRIYTTCCGFSEQHITWCYNCRSIDCKNSESYRKLCDYRKQSYY